MYRGARWDTVHGITESDMTDKTEQLTPHSIPKNKQLTKIWAGDSNINFSKEKYTWLTGTCIGA